MIVEVFVPKMSDHMAFGEIVAWAVSEGDWVEEGQTLLELQTDKVVVDLEASASGFLRGVRPGVVAGARVPVGETIAYIADRGEEIPALSSLEAQSPLVAQAAPDRERGAPIVSTPQRSSGEPPALLPSGKVRAVPAARRLARELGVDLSQVTGSGPGGRIRVQDVHEHKSRATAADDAGTGAHATWETGAALIPDVQDIPPAPAARYAALGVDVDMTRALDASNALDHSRTHLFCSALLLIACDRAFEREAVLPGQSHSLAVRLATKTGSMVVAVDAALGKSVSGLASELAHLEEEASVEASGDATGGVKLIVTDLGVYGIDDSVAAPGNERTLGLDMGRVAKKPRGLADDTIALVPIMRLTLSFDERTLDRLHGARLLASIAEFVAEPFLLL